MLISGKTPDICLIQVVPKVFCLSKKTNSIYLSILGKHFGWQSYCKSGNCTKHYSTNKWVNDVNLNCTSICSWTKNNFLYLLNANIIWANITMSTKRSLISWVASMQTWSIYMMTRLSIRTNPARTVTFFAKIARHTLWNISYNTCIRSWNSKVFTNVKYVLVYAQTQYQG